jgi:hypothetical protein
MTALIDNAATTRLLTAARLTLCIATFAFLLGATDDVRAQFGGRAAAGGIFGGGQRGGRGVERSSDQANRGARRDQPDAE